MSNGKISHVIYTLYMPYFIKNRRQKKESKHVTYMKLRKQGIKIPS